MIEKPSFPRLLPAEVLEIPLSQRANLFLPTPEKFRHLAVDRRLAGYMTALFLRINSLLEVIPDPEALRDPGHWQGPRFQLNPERVGDELPGKLDQALKKGGKMLDLKFAPPVPSIILGQYWSVIGNEASPLFPNPPPDELAEKLVSIRQKLATYVQVIPEDLKVEAKRAVAMTKRGVQKADLEQAPVQPTVQVSVVGVQKSAEQEKIEALEAELNELNRQVKELKKQALEAKVYRADSTSALTQLRAANAQLQAEKVNAQNEALSRPVSPLDVAAREELARFRKQERSDRAELARLQAIHSQAEGVRAMTDEEILEAIAMGKNRKLMLREMKDIQTMITGLKDQTRHLEGLVRGLKAENNRLIEKQKRLREKIREPFVDEDGEGENEE